MRARAARPIPRPARPDDALRTLGDDELIAAIRDDDHRAWREFDLRFRPALERYAACIGIPSADWPECVSNTVADAALRFTGDPAAALPASCMSYLMRAVRNRAANLSRMRSRALRVAEEASRAGSDAAPMPASECSRIAARLRDGMSPDQELLLAWVAEGVPYRQIADWLGIGYDAAAKRVARLTARLRLRIAAMADGATPAEQRAIAKLLDLPPIVRRT